MSSVFSATRQHGPSPDASGPSTSTPPDSSAPAPKPDSSSQPLDEASLRRFSVLSNPSSSAAQSFPSPKRPSVSRRRESVVSSADSSASHSTAANRQVPRRSIAHGPGALGEAALFHTGLDDVDEQGGVWDEVPLEFDVDIENGVVPSGPAAKSVEHIEMGRFGLTASWAGQAARDTGQEQAGRNPKLGEDQTSHPGQEPFFGLGPTEAHEYTNGITPSRTSIAREHQGGSDDNDDNDDALLYGEEDSRDDSSSNIAARGKVNGVGRKPLGARTPEAYAREAYGDAERTEGDGEDEEDEAEGGLLNPAGPAGMGGLRGYSALGTGSSSASGGSSSGRRNKLHFEPLTRAEKTSYWATMFVVVVLSIVAVAIGVDWIGELWWSTVERKEKSLTSSCCIRTLDRLAWRWHRQKLIQN